LNQVQYKSIKHLEQNVNSHFACYTYSSTTTFVITDTNMNTLFHCPNILLITL